MTNAYESKLIILFDICNLKPTYSALYNLKHILKKAVIPLDTAEKI